MHFTWPAWDKSLSVSSVHEISLRSLCLGFAGEPLPQDKICAFVWGKRRTQISDKRVFGNCGAVSCSLHGTRSTPNNSNMNKRMTAMGGVRGNIGLQHDDDQHENHHHHHHRHFYLNVETQEV